MLQTIDVNRIPVTEPHLCAIARGINEIIRTMNKESAPSASTNTGSPKLPNPSEVIADFETYHPQIRYGAELYVDRVRQLRAGKDVNRG